MKRQFVHVEMSNIRDLYFESKTGKPRRNFIRENIKRLQEINSNKGREPVPSNTFRTGSLPKFHRVLTELNDRDNEYKFTREISDFSLKPSYLKSSLQKENSHPAGLRHQSSQTIPDKDLESLYHDGVIRFPSRQSNTENRGPVKMVRTVSLQTDTPVHSRTPSPTLSGSPAGDSVKDFVKMNAMVNSQPKKQAKEAQDPIRPPPNYQMGVLPRYLRTQKKEQENLKVADTDCPEGHSVLPEEERLKHLAQLKLRYTELIEQLNSLPVRNDTLRVQRRRLEIETELGKVEAGIKLFSRDKLYIKIPTSS